MLLEVWRVSTQAAKRREERLKAEINAANKRVELAEIEIQELKSRECENKKGVWDAGSPSPQGNGATSTPNDALTEGDQGELATGAQTQGTSSHTTNPRQQEQQQQQQKDASVLATATIHALKYQVEQLQTALEACRIELSSDKLRIKSLEVVEKEHAVAKTKIEALEAELNDAKQRMGSHTPRPTPDHRDLKSLLMVDEERVGLVLKMALHEHKEMPVEELAAMLGRCGSNSEPTSGTETNDNPTASVTVAITSPSTTTTITTTTTTTTTAVADGSPAPQPPKPPPLLLLQSVPLTTLIDAIRHVRGSTSERYHLLDATAASLRAQVTALTAELETHREAERKREAARKRRDEEAQLEKKNAIQQYLDLLASQGEEAWKEYLIGMGQSQGVPKLFRHAGKIRNKLMSKRDTEKLVKELWKERLSDPAVAAGRAGELVDFLGAYLQKKVGIAAAVTEMGYSLLYGLWQYQWDADCELFLKILTGEIREEVYIAQARLQTDLEDLFAAMDKAKGQASMAIPKEDLRTALHAYFRVGQVGGKTSARFDEMMQALEQDQPGTIVEWKKVFEEDREFNQGEFAETLRDQFLQERIEFFSALEAALYEAAGNENDCTKEQVIRAVLETDPECNEKAAAGTVAGLFFPGLDSLSIRTVIKTLSKGMLRRGTAAEDLRASVGSGGSRKSVAPGKLSGGNASTAALAPKKQSEATSRALEAVRVDWIQKQLNQHKSNTPSNG